MLTSLVLALSLTVVLECGFALLWGVRGRRDLALTALVNCMTNPPVNLLYALLVRNWGWPAWPVTAGLEVAAVLVEWLCYRQAANDIRRPLAFSLCANGFSFSSGLLLQMLCSGGF